MLSSSNFVLFISELSLLILYLQLQFFPENLKHSEQKNEVFILNMEEY